MWNIETSDGLGQGWPTQNSWEEGEGKKGENIKVCVPVIR